MMCKTAEIMMCADGAMEPAKRGLFVPPDGPDASAVLLIPSPSTRPDALLRAEAATLFSEGARGPLARSLIARDLAASRLHLRSLELRRDFALRQLARGRGDERRVRLLADLAEKAHRSFLATFDAFRRLDVVAVPTVQVRADNAAFVVASEIRTQAG